MPGVRHRTTTGTENLSTTIDDSYSGYSLHETSSDEPDITLTGNNIDGTQDTTQIGDVTYSLHETNASGGAGDTGFTLDENGTKDYTLTGSDDANTGDLASVETGTDDYTLSETSIDGLGSSSPPPVGFVSTIYNVTDISVSGSEDYTISTSANSQSGDFSEGFTGGGDYDRTESGEKTITETGFAPTTASFSTEDSGSTDFNDEQYGDTRDGDVVLSNGGTDRYSLLYGFNNSSDGAGTGFGIVDYSPVGLPIIVTRMSVPAGIFTDIGDDRYDYCFAAGTLVLMADHPPRKIEEMEEGLRVHAVPDSQPESQPSPCHVMEVFRNSPAPIWHVRVAGDLIRTTANHPFYVRNKGWTAAAKLAPGDELRTNHSTWIEVEGVEESGVVEAVFNFRVEGNRTYFVWLGAAGVGVLVHNASIRGGRQSTKEEQAQFQQLANKVDAVAAGVGGTLYNTAATTLKMGNPITGIPTGIQMVKGAVKDYKGLEDNGYTPGTAAFTAACHALPIGQTAAAISDIQAGKSGNGADFGRKLTTQDYAAKGTGIVIDVTTSAVGLKGARDIVAPGAPAAPALNRLPQDVAVNPVPPDPLPLNRPVGKSATQNQMVQSDINAARAEGATDFRVNQQQVNAAGNRVGKNRPDLQYTDANGQRVNVEYDTTSSTRGPGHEARIKVNDPSSHVILKTVD